MSAVMNKDKLKKLAAEFAKDLKTSDDLSAFTRNLVKLTVETALNAELDEHLAMKSMTPGVAGRATAATVRPPNA